MNVQWFPDASSGNGKSAPWYSSPKPGPLEETTAQAIAKEGSLSESYSIRVQSSLGHMLDGFRSAIGPKELWSNFTRGSVPRWFFNSLVHAFGVILLRLSVSALTGYALSSLWPRKLDYWLELFFLATMMLPAMLLFCHWC